ncbi:MAG: nucleotidyltransferase domain-containing protein [Candidatus Gastranaerophilales bacterium]|nr:nucleotidyltransferase domain-containing protein [Candidatus Gastranaerophilales bacterium]
MNKVLSLDEIIKVSIPIAEKYGVSKLYIFGSYARKEVTENSDIDLLIDKGNIRNLLDYFALVSDLEDGFGKHVDVVTTTCNDKEFVENVMKEAILIYESKGQNYYSENLAVL